MATKKALTATTAPATPVAEPSLQFIDLDVIDTLPQVRTTFDEASLAELAESLKTHGMLQPLLLRPGQGKLGNRYAVIAGERRLRAARLAGLVAVPALVGAAGEDRAAEMQLVENIQREELSLGDTAKAVQQLYEKHQALKPIASLLGKSLAWVSKHLTAANKLNWAGQQLLESGKTEDLELILTVNAIYETRKYFPKGNDLVKQIEKHKAGRKEARELLEQLKAELAEDKKKKAAAKKALDKQLSLMPDNKTPKVRPVPQWHPEDGIADLNDQLINRDHAPIEKLLEGYQVEANRQMLEIFEDDYKAGKAAPKNTVLRRLAGYLLHDVYDGDSEAWRAGAYILGTMGLELTIYNLCTEVHHILHA